MKKTSKVIALMISTFFFLPILLIGKSIVNTRTYDQGFSQIKLGEAKQSVIDLMGKASETRSCSFSVNNANNNQAANCFEILTYNLPYQRWAFAFDKDGRVIEKYYWFLGEYGNKPPDQLS